MRTVPKVTRDALRAIDEEQGMSETVTITARRWSGGWELWSKDDCWTQVARLDRARQQVVDYLDTVDEDTDHSD